MASGGVAQGRGGFHRRQWRWEESKGWMAEAGGRGVCQGERPAGMRGTWCRGKEGIKEGEASRPEVKDGRVEGTEREKRERQWREQRSPR